MLEDIYKLYKKTVLLYLIFYWPNDFELHLKIYISVNKKLNTKFLNWIYEINFFPVAIIHLENDNNSRF